MGHLVKRKPDDLFYVEDTRKHCFSFEPRLEWSEEHKKHALHFSGLTYYFDSMWDVLDFLVADKDRLQNFYTSVLMSDK